MANRNVDQILTDEERHVLAEICDEMKVPIDIVEQMIAAEHRVYGMGRRHGIWEALETLVTEGLGMQPEESQQ